MLFRLDDQHVYRAKSLEQFPWLDHGFGTRLSNGWPDMTRLVTPKQIHSNRVLVVGDDAPAGPEVRMGQGDALVSSRNDLMVGVRTADCLPIVLVGANARSIGVIHAGWRGTVSNICGNAVREMVCQLGTQVSEIWAAVGPGIGACCFEVGPEVAVQFKDIFPERMDLEDRTRIDLAEANRRWLKAAGIAEAQIEVSGLCTVCRANEFHSYRREKDRAGRMLSAVGKR